MVAHPYFILSRCHCIFTPCNKADGSVGIETIFQCPWFRHSTCSVARFLHLLSPANFIEVGNAHVSFIQVTKLFEFCCCLPQSLQVGFRIVVERGHSNFLSYPFKIVNCDYLMSFDVT
jgi:hypothetical protein